MNKKRNSSRRGQVKEAEKKFSQIVQDIKTIKIQGARNISKAALKAYFLLPSKSSKKILLASRPTEPMMGRVLAMAEKHSEKEILNHFDEAQDKINKYILKLIKNNDIIFTHCHSTNVSNALIYARKTGKRFQVYNTETRPLFQGRKTADELMKAGIKVTMFIDSAFSSAIGKQGKNDKEYATKIFIGADALTKSGVVNKIGSRTLAEIASVNKVPLYVVADSWKFTIKKVPIEQRALNEVWDRAPKGVKIKNPAFEFVPKKYIKAIVTEFGVLSYDDFLRKVRSHSHF